MLMHLRTYPTINGTRLKFPEVIDLVGKSVINFPSRTGRNVLYGEALLMFGFSFHRKPKSKGRTKRPNYRHLVHEPER